MLFRVPQVGLKREQVSPRDFFERLLFAGLQKIRQRRPVRAMRFLFLVCFDFEQVGIDRIFEQSAPRGRLDLREADSGVRSGFMSHQHFGLLLRRRRCLSRGCSRSETLTPAVLEEIDVVAALGMGLFLSVY